MLLQIKEETQIEDPRQYGSEVINDLRKLLTEGVWAQCDPRRDNFYEIESEEGRAFYFHISPINGEVVLLAKWSGSAKENDTLAAQHSA